MKKIEVWVLEHIANDFDNVSSHFYPTRSEAVRAAINEKLDQMKKELGKT